MKAYSEEFRRDDLAARDAGESTHDVALRFKVFQAWVRRIDWPAPHRRRQAEMRAKKTDADRGGARDAEALGELHGQVLDAFHEDKCRNYFRHRGYRDT